MHSNDTSNTVDFPSWDELSELEQAQATFWDMYKDAYGVRPRGVDTSGWTLKPSARNLIIWASSLSVRTLLAGPPKTRL